MTPYFRLLKALIIWLGTFISGPASVFNRFDDILVISVVGLLDAAYRGLERRARNIPRAVYDAVFINAFDYMFFYADDLDYLGGYQYSGSCIGDLVFYGVFVFGAVVGEGVFPNLNHGRFHGLVQWPLSAVNECMGIYTSIAVYSGGFVGGLTFVELPRSPGHHPARRTRRRLALHVVGPSWPGISEWPARCGPSPASSTPPGGCRPPRTRRGAGQEEVPCHRGVAAWGVVAAVMFRTFV